MKIICKLFGHKNKYYRRSGDDTIYKVCCRCGHLSYKNDTTPKTGWVSMFLQTRVDSKS